MADIVPFQLSFTDTPGLGDNGQMFSDDDVCATIKKSIKSDAAAFIIYFIKIGEKQNRRHIAAIEKLEKATEKNIDAVVLTNAMKLPDFRECSGKPVKDTFDELRQELLHDGPRKDFDVNTKNTYMRKRKQAVFRILESLIERLTAVHGLTK